MPGEEMHTLFPGRVSNGHGGTIPSQGEVDHTGSTICPSPSCTIGLDGRPLVISFLQRSGPFRDSSGGIFHPELILGVASYIVNEACVNQYFPSPLPFHTLIQKRLHPFIQSRPLPFAVGGPHITLPTSDPCLLKSLGHIRFRVGNQVRDHLSGEEPGRLFYE